MSNKVNLINEIYNRIHAATAAGSALQDVKLVRVGFKQELRKQDDLPAVIITPTRGRENSNYQNKNSVDAIEIEIRLIVPKLASDTNFFYAEALQSGPLYLFEKLLNTLDKNESGEVDITFSGNANNLSEYSYDVNQYNDLIEFVLTISAETKAFRRGER